MEKYLIITKKVLYILPYPVIMALENNQIYLHHFIHFHYLSYPGGPKVLKRFKNLIKLGLNFLLNVQSLIIYSTVSQGMNLKNDQTGFSQRGVFVMLDYKGSEALCILLHS